MIYFIIADNLFSSFGHQTPHIQNLVAIFSLTHKGNFPIVLPRKKRVLIIEIVVLFLVAYIPAISMFIARLLGFVY